MSSAYWAPLVTVPIIITAPGQYRTRRGEAVTVDRESRRYRQDFGCVGRYANGVVEGWHRSGRLLATSETQNDIVASAGEG